MRSRAATFAVLLGVLLVCSAHGASVEELRRLASDGDRSSQLTLGLMYSRGLGVTEDRTEALKWLSMAAEQGSAEASDELRRISASSDQDGVGAAARGTSKPTAGSVPAGAGRLHLLSNPPGTLFSLFSSNSFRFSGIAPFQTDAILPGEYSVCFERQGYDLFWKNVSVDERTPPVAVTLRATEPQRAPVGCVKDLEQSLLKEKEEAEAAVAKTKRDAEIDAARARAEAERIECYTSAVPALGMVRGVSNLWTEDRAVYYKICRDKVTGQTISKEVIPR